MVMGWEDGKSEGMVDKWDAGKCYLSLKTMNLGGDCKLKIQEKMASLSL